jgi:hypothetical protein
MADTKLKSIALSALIPEEYDEVVLSYTDGELTEVVYKRQGSVKATLTLTYDGSGNLSGVVRS